MSRIKKLIGKLIAGSWFPFYNFFYERLKLDRQRILLESRGGNGLEGNLLRILEELSGKSYAGFRCMLSVRKSARKAIKRKIKEYGIKGVKLVKFGSLSYYYWLAKAGYLVNDTSFPGKFVKKDGQIYFNTWHGTPLKKMGRDNVGEIYSMGNVMRNLIQSDYLLFPNGYMEEKMVNAYMLSGLFAGKILEEGYPRNSIFFDTKQREVMREKLGCKDQQVLVYMPTFRGKVDNIETKRQGEELTRLLGQIEKGLKDSQLMYVKLHPFLNITLDVKEYRHIRLVPEGYDIYDVLNASDVLITDYSSVFYDYANTDNKIILFTYDEEEYEGSRGIYEDLTQYPFPRVTTVEELLAEIEKPGVEDRQQFRKRYCTYDGKAAAERICRHVFLDQKVCVWHSLVAEDKENILIYAGDLDKNGITTALTSMLAGLDKNRFRYYISFRRSSLEKAPERLAVIPDECGILPLASEMNMDMLTIMAQLLYFRKGWNSPWIKKKLDQAYRREWKKHFGGIEFRHIIHYNGYERYVIALFQRFGGVRTIWVHNDMQQEIAQKGNQNYYQLREAYRSYDHVVVVSRDIFESTEKISGRADNIVVIGNCHNYREVKERAERPLAFEADTESTVTKEELERILDSSATKFINIGRFSVEKGHERLIRAFERYWQQHKETYLIIIGGTGKLYAKTVQWAENSAASEHIVLIRSMKNPMPVLKKCQLFILSSVYEGLGLVMLEADTLGVPVVACDVNGPRGFVKEHGGTLVADSEEGIYEGMQLFDRHQVSCMKVDYEAMNQSNIEKCEHLL